MLIKEFVLASESPRRKSLLEEAGFHITVFPVKVSESLEKNLTVQAQIRAISQRKFVAAKTQWNRTKGQEALLLTADTMVVHKGQALGKPEDSDDAVNTLLRLSNEAHQVMTAITLGLSSRSESFDDLVTTDVFFNLISRQQAEAYVQTGEPMDKAGSYGIQGLGRQFVEKFVGPYDNVVGLPVSAVLKICQEHGWQLPPRPS
ncbi:MAG: Maf family protein [Bdellovibrio sp.]|jgi:septum formation protein